MTRDLLRPVAGCDHEPFRFRTAAALRRKALELGLDLPFDDDLSPLLQPLAIGGLVLTNRIAVQPMEGVDAETSGAPSELTFRRYRRYGEGGSGLIWFEATAVSPDGRSNPHAMMLTAETAAAVGRLVAATRRAATDRFGGAHRPFLVLQLTHAGRFSRPGPSHVTRIACPNPHLDRLASPGAPPSIWTDEELDALRNRFIAAVGLAMEAGFDAVDVKACHGYLVSELLGASTRAGGYGGDFAARSRFLLDVVAGARRLLPSARVAVRLNAADFIPHPYGFGMADDGSARVDLTEPLDLVRTLCRLGCCLLNVTAGIPRVTPHIGRPCDRPAAGAPHPPEHPLAGVARLIALAAAVQGAAGTVPVVGTGYSWLRQFWPNVGAAAVASRQCALVGVGRAAFAYPDAAVDLMTQGRLETAKCCVACSYCSESMRAGRQTGCVVRDREAYAPPERPPRPPGDRR